MNNVFKNFEDFWSKTRHLCKKDREKILDTLSFSERKSLVKSYKEGGWEDVEMRNNIDRILKQIKKDIGIDLLFIRTKVILGNSVYIKKAQWDYICDIFKEYKEKHTYYVLGNIIAQEENNDTILLLSKNKFVKK